MNCPFLFLIPHCYFFFLFLPITCLCLYNSRTSYIYLILLYSYVNSDAIFQTHIPCISILSHTRGTEEFFLYEFMYETWHFLSTRFCPVFFNERRRGRNLSNFSDNVCLGKNRLANGWSSEIWICNVPRHPSTKVKRRFLSFRSKTQKIGL